MGTNHEMALGLYGLTKDSAALCHYRSPSGSVGFFYAPAVDCFRCLGVCPGYWSLESLARFASKAPNVPGGSSVWYGLTDGPDRQVIVNNSPAIVAV